MEKLESKLFESFKISNKEALKTIGGAKTSAGSDTSMTGGRYDIAFETTDTKSIDTVNTGTGTLDQPSQQYLQQM
jgi:hypothetical protein